MHNITRTVALALLAVAAVGQATADAAAATTGDKPLTFVELPGWKSGSRVGTASSWEEWYDPRRPSGGVPSGAGLDGVATAGQHEPLTVHVLTMPARGHYNPLVPVVKALVARGHNVSFVLATQSHPWFEADQLRNLGVGLISGGPVDLERAENALRDVEGSADEKNIVDKVLSLGDIMRESSESMFRHIAAVYEDPNSRPDVLLADAETPIGSTLQRKFGIPRVAHVGCGVRSIESTPSWLPLFQSGDSVQDLTTLHRAVSAAFKILLRYLIAPLIDDVILGFEPSIGLQRRAESAYSAGVPTLYNTHWGLEHARPLQPYEFLVGHSGTIGEIAPLPRDLQEWLDAERRPCVYIALGSVAIASLDTWSTMFGAMDILTGPDSLRFIIAARGPNQDAIKHLRRWRNQTSTLMLEWAPQPAVLAHPKVRSFLTHSGMNSLGESIASSVPVVCMPFFTDQKDNCQRAVDKGFGIRMPQRGDGMSVKQLRDALDATTSDVRYRHAAERSRLASLHGGGTGTSVRVVEQTAFGVLAQEYLLPHNLDLPWWAYTGLDVVVFWLVTIASMASCCWCSSRCCFRCCVRRCCGIGRNQSKTKAA